MTLVVTVAVGAGARPGTRVGHRPCLDATGSIHAAPARLVPDTVADMGWGQP